MLTATAVAKYKAKEKRQEISDAGAPGLRLVIHPTGSKVWIARFRRPGGKQGNLTLGPLDSSGNEDHEPKLGHPLSLAAARALANELSRQRKREVDVIALRSAEKHRARVTMLESSANTFAIGARDFIDEHTVRKTGKKPRRWTEQARMLGLDYSKGEPSISKGSISDRWRDKAVGDISEDDIYLLVEEARRRGIPGMAKRSNAPSDARGRHMAAVLSALFKWLKAHRRIRINPTIGMTKPAPSRSRDRVLTNDEIKSFWAACGTLGDPFGPMLKILLLTGCRLNEIARLTQSELVGDLIRLPGIRTKNGLPHDVPLPPLALEILAGIERIPNCKFLFSGTGRSPVSGFSKAKARIDKHLRIAPWTFHDLRRSAATGMAEIGVQPHIIESLLNHISGAKASVAGVYNRARYADEKRAAMEKWAEHVRGIVQ